MDPMPIADTLDQVGPRLKRIRTQRGVTLAALAEATGISKSTLSRLENGERRPSLELLLPLAHAHRVPLDDLVGAPEVGDPSVLELVPRTPAIDPGTRGRALTLASLAFRFRRKTLVNALHSIVGRGQVEGALEELGRGPKARAEELSLADYVALAGRLDARAVVAAPR